MVLFYAYVISEKTQILVTSVQIEDLGNFVVVVEENSYLMLYLTWFLKYVNDSK